MQAQDRADMQTSGRIDPKCRNENSNRSAVIPFMIDGCTISFTPTNKGTDGPMKEVKDILMSAYRTKITNR